jgi:hypothetical protein
MLFIIDEALVAFICSKMSLEIMLPIILMPLGFQSYKTNYYNKLLHR